MVPPRAPSHAPAALPLNLTQIVLTHLCYSLFQVANGMDARAAWKVCGCPCGEPGIQNIHQRGLNACGKKAVEAVMLSVALNRDEHIGAVLSPPPPEQASIKGVPEKGFRLTTLQLQKEKSIAAANRAAFDAAYIAATLEWQQMVREGKCGRGDACADGVAQRYANTLPAGCTLKLTGRSLKIMQRLFQVPG